MPQLNSLAGQNYIAFSVAHTESFTNGQGQKQERTTWISCLKYGESAVINYLKKGTRVFVRGDLSAKIYDANGTPQVGINCRVKELQLLGGSKQTEQTENREAGQAPAYSQNEPPFSDNNNGDDLPF